MILFFHNLGHFSHANYLVTDEHYWSPIPFVWAYRFYYRRQPALPRQERRWQRRFFHTRIRENRFLARLLPKDKSEPEPPQYCDKNRSWCRNDFSFCLRFQILIPVRLFRETQRSQATRLPLVINRPVAAFPSGWSLHLLRWRRQDIGRHIHLLLNYCIPSLRNILS